MARFCLVLTGTVLPGFLPESVWPALATRVRMAPEQFAQLMATMPQIIMQHDDFQQLRVWQADIAKIGAHTEICEPDDRPALFVQIDGAPCGPVPRKWVEQRIQYGQWAQWMDTMPVAEVGGNEWKPYSELVSPPKTPPPVAAPVASAISLALVEPEASYQRSSLSDGSHPALAGAKFLAKKAEEEAADDLGEDVSIMWKVLPEGAAVHAGFWWRFAACALDALIIAFILIPVMLVISVTKMFVPLAGFLVFPVSLGIIFWYFPWQESSETQATFGKRAMEIKAVDKQGRAIDLGRATWRYLSVVLLSLLLSGVPYFSFTDTVTRDSTAIFSFPVIAVTLIYCLILTLSYAMAGWTRRKQALYDMLSGVCIVFNKVEPGFPLPAKRPAMPWYGWMINIVVFVFCIGLTVFGVSHYQRFKSQLHAEVALKSTLPLIEEINKEGCESGVYSANTRLIEKIEVLATGLLRGEQECTITLTLSQSSNTSPSLRGESIKLTADKSGNWFCSSTAMPDYYLPAWCRVTEER
ncbi:MAG: RDD family protein [Zoogloeaceae bacterium]|nr:RDD family protein [Zoogloeaceae bacterium]